MPQRRPRVFVVALRKSVLSVAGARFPQAPRPFEPSPRVRLSDILDCVGLGESESDRSKLTKKMQDNVRKYNIVFGSKRREQPKALCAVVDLSRDPGKAWGELCSLELPTLTTQNTYLWVVGNIHGTVSGMGRWLTLVYKTFFSSSSTFLVTGLKLSRLIWPIISL